MEEAMLVYLLSMLDTLPEVGFIEFEGVYFPFHTLWGGSKRKLPNMWHIQAPAALTRRFAAELRGGVRRPAGEDRKPAQGRHGARRRRATASAPFRRIGACGLFFKKWYL